MADQNQVTVQAMIPGALTPRPWADARIRLAGADRYWLTTVRPDGQPHVMPVLAVWADSALYFCTSENSRKGKNLKRNSRCVIAAGDDALDLVFEGNAARVNDAAKLHRVASAYASKYDWHVTVRDGVFHDAEGAPTAGSPPYDVYEVTPKVAFGFGSDATFGPTRWHFQAQ